jgi:hypothetical protein
VDSLEKANPAEGPGGLSLLPLTLYIEGRINFKPKSSPVCPKADPKSKFYGRRESSRRLRMRKIGYEEDLGVKGR